MKTFLALLHGIPSHDTFGRVFARIDPQQFEQCFLSWVQSLNEKISGVVAIDGKTVRRSHGRARGKKALHLVSAWASEARLVLGQVAVEEKSFALEKTAKIGIKAKRLRAGWSQQYLLQVLDGLN